MMTNVIKMFGTALTDASATVESHEDCVIQAVLFTGTFLGIADQEGVRGEISFASTSGFTSNDTRASIAGFAKAWGITTSGGVEGSLNIYIGGLLVPVAAGERIYLHMLQVTGATTVAMSAYLYCIGRQATRMSDRRRA